MVAKYESCRLAKIKEGQLNKFLDFVNKNISPNGVVYKITKNKRDSSKIKMRLFLIDKKSYSNRIEIRIAFDTPYHYLDYIQFGEDKDTIRHSIFGKMIIYTSGENKNYLVIVLKKNRSRQVVTQLNKLMKEDILEFVTINLSKSDTEFKDLTNYWASDIQDDYESSLTASGNELEKSNTFKITKQKRAHLNAVKVKSGDLNYGLSEEGLVWIIPKEGIDFDKFLEDSLANLKRQDMLNH